MAQSNITGPLNKVEAQALTDRIRNSTDTLWSLLLEAHDRRAWKALGYTTWEAYVAEEISMGRSYSYRLLDQARVITAIKDATGNVSPMGDISERAARDVKDDLPAVTAEIKERVAKGEDPKQAVAETVAKTREKRTKDKEAKKAQQAEYDRQRDEAAAKLPDAIKARDAVKKKAIADRKEAAAQPTLHKGLTAEDRIAELEDHVREIEAEVETLRAENKLYGEMRAEYEKGGFAAVIAGKDEVIRVAEERIYSESADKASWMKSAKYWQAEAKKLGWSNTESIDLQTGEVTRA